MSQQERDEQEARLAAILERVDVAAHEILAAAKAGNIVRVKAALVYWFGVFYDEGRHRVHEVEQHNATLKSLVERLKQMNARLRAKRPPDPR